MSKILDDQQPARRSRTLRALFAVALLVPVISVADERRTCFKINAPGTSQTVNGDALRVALIGLTNNKKNSNSALRAIDPPASPQRCTGAATAIPAPDRSNYFGDFKNKTQFRRLADKPCDGTAPTLQYFSMGKAIYYRNCQGGAGNNYIYFWGKQDGNASTCFGSSYPEMYTVATSLRSNPLTASRVQATFNGTGIGGDDASTYALGNIMAALQISEAARDIVVTPANYMLVDGLVAGSTTLEKVLSGRCPAHATGCGNPDKPQDGDHPLAWGGALGAMMTGGGWGTTNGATSEFGKGFETDLIVKWLTAKGKITKTSTCNSTQTADQQRSYLFDELF